jgi:hypothetical protein
VKKRKRASKTARGKGSRRHFRKAGRHSSNLAGEALSARSDAARDRARQVRLAMRHNPELSLSRAARLKKVKPSTVLKYYGSDFRKSAGQFQVSKGDRRAETVYVPDSHGQIVPRETKSSAERSEASEFLRELNRYTHGKPNNLADWKNRTIGGIDLLTDPATIRVAEPVLSDFSLYRGIGGN